MHSLKETIEPVALGIAQEQYAAREGGHDHIYIDPVKEKKIVRKLDMYIVPVFMITYLFSFLDRSNLGNAKVAGMETDLGLVKHQFNVVTSIFYVTYVVFEVPLTILFKVVGPSKMVPVIMISWSLVTCFTGFCQSYGGLLACRLILGACESALFPSLNLYVSMFWKREEIARRASGIGISLSLAGAFGGLFAWAILQMDGTGGYAGWRWLFFIEGAISFCLGIAAYWLFPDSPETAYFLTPEEREIARARLEMHGNYEPLDYAHVKAAFKDPVCWLSGWIQFNADIYNYSISTFLPTIIKGLGYTSLQVQYMTIPCYLLGTIAYFTCATLSDKTKRRGPFMLFAGIFIMTGYAVLLGSHKPHVRYFACFLVLFGAPIVPGLNLTWLNTNMAPHYKRATAIGINQTIGNSGGVIAGQIFLTGESPYYKTGMAVSLTAVGLTWCSTWVMMWILRKRNAEKDRKIAEGFTDDGKGDMAVHFKYQL
ncbi:high-affinity nicotinic acid transporter-like protein [Exophiala viscosa]|uniref:High-affinity nicotinic acid transporter-like protein n=1 Tax=Exophiala viscosa TaxID=2486360 RepID=A0AAN6E202_9EURO|nr:high-affinity nicotinic acid transporter-like protein [Exophiala viscosa]